MIQMLSLFSLVISLSPLAVHCLVTISSFVIAVGNINKAKILALRQLTEKF